MASMDFMAVGAHPDDVEIYAGGTLLRLKALGKTGVIVDITDGGAGTRGSASIRAREAKAAAQKLGLERIALQEPDGQVQNTLAAQAKLIRAIRKFRPRVLFTHHFSAEHPDHGQTALLVKDAAFRAGIFKLKLPGESWRPKRLFHFLGAEGIPPSFCVDISAYWEAKMESILCYESQVFNPKAKKFPGKTDLARPAFLEALEIRARFFGSRIKRRYAEAFYCEEIAEVDDPTGLGGERFPSATPRQARDIGSGQRP